MSQSPKHSGPVDTKSEEGANAEKKIVRLPNHPIKEVLSFAKVGVTLYNRRANSNWSRGRCAKAKLSGMHRRESRLVLAHIYAEPIIAERRCPP
jgi:hypothetical protein